MKFRSLATVVLMILTALIVLSACNGGPTPTSTPGGRVVNVETSEFAFAPNKFDVKVGDKLTFKITNKGVLDHSFAISDAAGAVISRVDVRIGNSASLDFAPAKAGTFQLTCDVPGHKDSGMTGSINVTP